DAGLSRAHDGSRAPPGGRPDPVSPGRAPDRRAARAAGDWRRSREVANAVLAYRALLGLGRADLDTAARLAGWRPWSALDWPPRRIAPIGDPRRMRPSPRRSAAGHADELVTGGPALTLQRRAAPRTRRWMVRRARLQDSRDDGAR